jgi:Glycosyltransferase family 25 (LPS biosynthesis protein)
MLRAPRKTLFRASGPHDCYSGRNQQESGGRAVAIAGALRAGLRHQPARVAATRPDRADAGGSRHPVPVLRRGGRTRAAHELHACYNQAGALRRLGRRLTGYRTILHDDQAAAVVLEDDAIIGNEFATFCRTCANLPQDIELLSLHAEHGFVRRKPAFLWGEGAIHKARSNLSTTVGYFLRRSVAQKVVDGAAAVETVADWPFDHRSVRHYLMVPMPVGHAYGRSTIHEERNMLGARRLAGFARIAQFVQTVSYLKYLQKPVEYDGLANYHDREVAPRLMRRLPFLYLDVARMPHAAC